jgi:hypothetical protein
MTPGDDLHVPLQFGLIAENDGVCRTRELVFDARKARKNVAWYGDPSYARTWTDRYFNWR